MVRGDFIYHLVTNTSTILHLDIYQAPEAFEMIAAVFRGAVRTRRDNLQ
jgi:hypothetical protein